MLTAVTVILNKGYCMKSIALFLLFVFMPCVCAALNKNNYASYQTSIANIDTEYSSVWGSPIVSDNVVENSGQDGEFRIKSDLKCYLDTGKWCQNRSLGVFIAHDVDVHGAKFCITQVFAATGNDKFYIYYQTPYVPGDFQCAWFCEPGYSGERCQDKDVNSYSMACDNTDYEAVYDRLHGTGNGKLSLAGRFNREGVVKNISFFTKEMVYNGRYQQDIVLGVTDFMKHGVVVQPMLLSTNGTVAASETDTNYYTGLSATPASGGLKKVLCAQGFTKNDRCEQNSSTCSGNIDWCRYWRENTTWGQYVVNGYDSSLHYKEPAEEWVNPSNHSQGKQTCYNPKCKNGFDMGADLKCSACSENAKGGFCDVKDNENYNKCIKCNLGQYFSKTDCECKPVSKIIKLNVLQYGPEGNDQCWTMENDAEKYKTCTFGKTN